MCLCVCACVRALLLGFRNNLLAVVTFCNEMNDPHIQYGPHDLRSIRTYSRPEKTVF